MSPVLEPSPPKRLDGAYSEKEAADLLGCSVRTLRRYRQANLIGYRKSGRRILFTATHIERYWRTTECLPAELDVAERGSRRTENIPTATISSGIAPRLSNTDAVQLVANAGKSRKRS